MRRTLRDLLLSACALLVLLLALMAFDGRVRDGALMRGKTQASTELAAAGEQAHSLASLLVQVAKDQSRRHASMMLLVGAATALTLFMVRT